MSTVRKDLAFARLRAALPVLTDIASSMRPTGANDVYLKNVLDSVTDALRLVLFEISPLEGLGMSIERCLRLLDEDAKRDQEHGVLPFTKNVRLYRCEGPGDDEGSYRMVWGSGKASPTLPYDDRFVFRGYLLANDSLSTSDAQAVQEALQGFGEKLKAEPDDTELFNGRPGCSHMTVPAPGGGVRCVKCPGWFCY